VSVRHLTQLARDTEAHELMFYTPVYNSTEGLGSHELVATNLGIARLAGRDRRAAFHRPLGQDDRLGVCTGFERRKTDGVGPIRRDRPCRRAF
jgi:hypothetical protein